MATRTNRGAVALRDEMRRRGLSQGDVRRELGMGTGVITRWLSGGRLPDAKSSSKIQERYGIASSLWFEEVDAADATGRPADDDEEPRVA
jgi:transcriptional regulator with XRE-family HTH domain